MEAVQLLTTRRDETVRQARVVNLQLLTLALIGTLFWLLAFAALLTPSGRAWVRQVLEPSCATPLYSSLAKSEAGAAAQMMTWTAISCGLRAQQTFMDDGKDSLDRCLCDAYGRFGRDTSQTR